MTNANEEFFELAGKAQGATPEQLRSVAEVARNATAIMKQITILEKQVKELNGAYQKIVTTTLPQILISAGLSEFKNEDKTVHVELKTIVSGTLPKDEERRKVALQKIIEAGGEGLIKTDIELSFTKNQHNEALSLFEELKDRNIGVLSMNEGIHSQSLCAFAREKMAEGHPLPHEEVGLFVSQIAKIKIKDEE